jgi:hypothetical protein
MTKLFTFFKCFFFNLGEALDDQKVDLEHVKAQKNGNHDNIIISYGFI